MNENETTALIPAGETAIEAAPTVHLVARNPAEMDAARADLATWLNMKLSAIEAEVKDLNASINEARTNGWKVDALTRARNKAVAQETYYFKMLKAVEAGYTIIPEFPIDVFAIRVTRSNVRVPARSEDGTWGYPVVNDERPDQAPAGEGEYKNPSQLVRHSERKEQRGDREVTVRTTKPVDFGSEIVFPMIAARPVVMNATAEAMALKVFDQIGIARPIHENRQVNWGKGDPLIIGQILLSRHNQRDRVANFIIAWHVNLNDL